MVASLSAPHSPMNEGRKIENVELMPMLANSAMHAPTTALFAVAFCDILSVSFPEFTQPARFLSSCKKSEKKKRPHGSVRPSL